MKELSIKEKSSRYDEAIEKARNILEYYHRPGFKDILSYAKPDLESIFPELKESGDEKARKAINDIIHLDNNEIRGVLDLHNISYQEVWTWFEKQKEKEEHQAYETEDGEIITYSEIDGCKVVEPKFKVGDWLANDYCTGKIIALTDDAYLLDSGQGIPFSCEHNAHLWTIQDAKDGDVLVDEDNNIGIFRECEGIDWNSYIYLGCDGKLRGFSIGAIHRQTDTHPATKEQRYALLKAMADAGYTFDFDKKELKKIEQNPAWSEVDEYTLGETIQHLEELIRIEKVKHCGIDVQYYQRDIDWLKSLKDRVQPQIKQKWSEDDKKKYIGELQSLMFEWSNRKENMGICIDRHIDKLLSLHPQSHWKPSDEQMYNLKWVGNVLLSHHDSIVEKDSAEKLNSLYEDLKKLMEE